VCLIGSALTFERQAPEIFSKNRRYQCQSKYWTGKKHSSGGTCSASNAHDSRKRMSHQYQLKKYKYL